MPPRPPVDAEAIRAFVARDRAPVTDARARYWADRKRRLGLAEVLRVADQLRDQARALAPGWPSEAERDADLETHQRVAAALARVPAPTAAARGPALTST